jgi:glycosyltransferase involved in cell wall biosynthesis
MLRDITPLILTYNEAPNIERTLKAVNWAKQILVVDSFSADATLEIVRRFPQVRVIQRRFDTFAGQCNFGLQHVATPWVLSLDADYVVSDALVDEIAALPDDRAAGYRASFRYCIAGRPLRSSLYPPRAVLYRRDSARYVDEGHGHRVQIDGPIRDLRAVIHHDDRKPFSRWLSEQNKYMRIESRHLVDADSRCLTLQDRLRRWVVFAPLAVLVYTLILKGLVLDGWPGWAYAAQRTLAEILLSARIAEARIRGRA